MFSYGAMLESPQLSLFQAGGNFISRVATRKPSVLEGEDRASRRPIRIGLLVPFRGADAIWGPSCQYSGVLAAAELNQKGGILGRPVQLSAADAGGDPELVEDRVRKLLATDGADVLIGVHLSSVRERLSRAFGNLIPYIFTPLYEGGATEDGTFAIGETPANQLAGAVDHFTSDLGARSWFLMGHDYVWPRKTHDWLSRHLRASGCEVSGEEYHDLNEDNFEAALDRIERARPSVVMQSLVGSACLEFNRAFARRGLDRHVLRLSGALEENTLMALEPEARRNLYCVSSYFASLDCRSNRDFLERYYAVFGKTAPVQSALSISCYDGMNFFAALAEGAGSISLSRLGEAFHRGLVFEAAKGAVHLVNGTSVSPTYLAKAGEAGFDIVKRFAP
ncbi:substrate-binding domain-containing protein [Paracoccus sp. MBLB3053]|uniref:Substrate-binding domain-containing protein n=1 Tax=Paracoccus aurantius TaxID=3073814 RepID=A0ABU2HTV5_9RHOB|nr:substrate-binding domain-containing protein [Paracoccus sp. MBLB3053]MDS9468479.1 substrate-binding domain-containing protein [Paracoccus sp. MBLB3053]